MAWWEQWLLGLMALAALMIRGLPMANSFNDWMKRKSQQSSEGSEPEDDLGPSEVRCDTPPVLGLDSSAEVRGGAPEQGPDPSVDDV
ncbi:MAG: hypothetical protein AVDCRST_MAG76-2774 [uncultured Acidimicrobiales bacterium]|uniref:Uncharacterized protein n=1 Tax=uncultured Acidimicrobiales bacterium TaxID=310071 RepID=A0A6J4IV32_9ACTN|nr:MAG: hypothetical protein AVDCRST_MAG76-2774 [uncultured Acidimicrobiales bacterium]